MIGEDTGISLGLLLIVVGLASAGIGGLWWRLETRFAVERERREKLAGDFADYKLHVERHFVSQAVLERTEERMITAFEKLTARVEALIGRVETVSVELAKFSGEK